MSTVAPRPPAPPANAAINPALLDSERYIDDHIGRTRRALKLADFSAGVIVLVAGVLAFLLVAGVIDHWIIPGGLGPAGRIALFGLLVLGVGWHAWRRFVPLLRSINPVYAAHTIEKSSPTLKNSLLNVILFRGHRQQMSAKVFHALEQQAAQRLSAAPAEGSVDHAALLRLGYALLAVVAACTLYAVLSPKNLAVSAIRIIDPWADVSAPSRVKILNIEPGETSVARGERVAISAEVHAIGEDEPVRLRYSTDDEQLVDETITMTRPVGATRFAADLPRATDSNRAAGVMNNLEYWIEAGDARSPRFKLSVFDRPTIVVQRVEYHAPAYTGEPSRSVDNVGDIRGLEGTTVAIEALANQPIRTAYVDFDADGTNDLKMAIDGERATAGFELKLRPDRRTPLHDTYVLRYTTTEGRANSDPAQYSIDVTPDYAPEVRITKPEEPEVTVRVGDTVQLGAEARDPDYALSQVRVMGRVGEKDMTIVDMPLKDGRGRFTGSRMFTPADAGLKAGDVLEYWAEARDNRRPEPNIGMSEHRRMRIVAADAPGGGQQQNNRGGGQPQQGDGQNQGQGGANGQGGQQGGAQQQGGEDGAEGEAGGEGEQGQQGGAAGGQGESDQGQNSNSGEAASAAGQSGGENSEAGAQGEQSGQGGSQSENGEQSNEQQGAEGSEGGAGGEQSQQENGQAGENPSGGQPGDNGAAGGAQGGQQEKVSADGDDDPTAFERIREHMGVPEGESGSHGGEGGQQQAGEQQQGEQQQGSQRPGEQQNDPGENPRAGESDAGTERRGANENPNNQSANNPSAGELADGKPGEGEAATEQGKPGANGSKKPSGDGKGNSEGEGETPAGADGALNENNGKSPSGDDASGAPGAPEATTKRDRDGKPGDEGQSAAEGEPPTDDARGKDESHARGDQSGDRSGSGQKGGGQQADNAGQGEAGSHTAADTGAGQSEDQGAGETGTEAGDEQLADGKTGESSGHKPGAGSESGEAAGEQQPPGGEEQAGDEQQSGKTAGEQQQGAGGQQGGSSEQQSESDAGQQGDPGQAGQAGQAGGQSAGDDTQSESQGEQQSGAQAGGSPPGEGSNDPSDPTEGDQQGAGRGGAASAPPTRGGTQGGGVSGNNGGGEPGGDKANLDFARRQVDLVLEKLDDQLEQHKVDPKLLKSLGWTEDELQRFVTRWQGLKARAAEGGEDAADANAQLDAALRSLGLRQNGPQRFRAGATADKLRDLNDAYRARAPQEYLDRVREYTKGVSAAEEE